MRCSNCMSTMVEEGSTLTCKSCGRIMDAKPIEIPSPGQPGLAGRAGLAGPEPSAWTAFAGRALLWGLGVVIVLATGATGGWMLRDGAGDDATATPLTALVSLVRNPGTPAGADTEPVIRIIPVTGAPLDGRSMIVQRLNGGLALHAYAPSGTLRAETPLRLDTEGRLMAAAVLPDGPLVTAFRAGDEIRLLATSRAGQTLWRRRFDHRSGADGPIHLQPLGTGVALIQPGETRTRIAVSLVDAQGLMVWQRSLEGLANAELQVDVSPYDELVLVHDLADASTLHITLIGLSGLPGLSRRLERTTSEVPVAVKVDDRGSLYILLAGAPPRLVIMDALGQITRSDQLIQIERLDGGTPCLMQGPWDHLLFACADDSGITLSRFDARTEGPALLGRQIVPAQGVTRMIPVSATHLLAEISQDNNQGRVLSVIDLPHPDTTAPSPSPPT